MGASPWSYFVPYEPEIAAAFDALKERIIPAPVRARYAELSALAEVVDDQDGDPEDVAEMGELMAMGDDPLAILNMMNVSDGPGPTLVAPLEDVALVELFGSAAPTREAIEKSNALFDRIERGEGVYVVAYDAGEPSEIFFAGYTFD